MKVFNRKRRLRPHRSLLIAMALTVSIISQSIFIVPARAQGSGPTASFQWRMEDRTVDFNGDGFIDDSVYGMMGNQCYLNPEATGCPDPRPWVVRFTAQTIDLGRFTYDWNIQGAGCIDLDPFAQQDVQVAYSDTHSPKLKCYFAKEGTSYEASLNVTDRLSGISAVHTEQVKPEDILIVSIGDSVASGEGNPDVPGSNPVWQDKQCHRSAKAGPAQAALAMENSDPHTSVTFLHLACSGAGIFEGLIGPYAGQEPQLLGGCLSEQHIYSAPPTRDGRTFLRCSDLDSRPHYCVTQEIDDAFVLLCFELIPPQIDEVTRLLCPVADTPDIWGQTTCPAGGRQIDVLMISVGFNDVGVGDIIKACAVLDTCQDRDTSTLYDIIGFSELNHWITAIKNVNSAVGSLPGRFDVLHTLIGSELSIDPRSVYITQYFDPTGDENGFYCNPALPETKDVAEADKGWFKIQLGDKAFFTLDFDGLTTDELDWGINHEIIPINQRVSEAASAYGWNYVEGLMGAFFYHGVCASDNWVNGLNDSRSIEGINDGVMHPNAKGHFVYRDFLVASIKQRLTNQPPRFAVTTGNVEGANGWLVGWCGFKQIGTGPYGIPLFTRSCRSDLATTEVRVEDPDGFVQCTALPCPSSTPSLSINGTLAAYTQITPDGALDCTMAGVSCQLLFNNVTPSVAWTITLTVDSLYQFDFVATDGKGLASTLSYEAKVDFHDPATAATVTSGTAGNGGWFVSPIQVTVSGTDPAGGSGVSSLEYLLDGGQSVTVPATFQARGPSTFTTVVAIAGDGNHTLSYQAFDVAGRKSTNQTLTLRIDSTPPETVISSVIDANGASLANGGSTLFGPATFNFQGSDAVSGVAGFECSLDGAAFTPCTSGFSGGATTGSHTFQVRALDVAGNVDLTPELFTWTIVTPAQATQNTIDTVKGMGLASSTQKSLLGPLTGALQILSDTNPNNDLAACSILKAFVMMVDRYEMKGLLSSTQANDLRLQATNLQIKLGCP